jgi:murein L,D-transpeptidase YcbB/YkuD
MRALLCTAFALLSMVALAGCGGQSASSRAVAASIQQQLAALQHSAAAVSGERLLEPATLAHFYAARQSRPVWNHAAAGEIVDAIGGITRDGLNPGDYHLEAIQKLLGGSADSRPSAASGELDILLTDAVAGMADHIRYGRVRPASLNPEWNVDPREGAPPLETTLATIASSSSVRHAIDDQRPDHFIYRGLVDALARLRDIESHGGWPTVSAGGKIRPRGTDPRIPVIRARLAVSGEFSGPMRNDGATYDDRLREAVQMFQADYRLAADGVIDAGTIDAMNISASVRASQVRVNLERARWVLAGLKDDFMLVNLPAFKAYLIQNGKNIWEARTQIGDEAKQTPTFRATMQTVVLNPDWAVPSSILAEELLQLQSGKQVLAEKGLVLTDDHGQVVDPSSINWKAVSPTSFPYTLRQPPGEDNALGRVKFLFPNPYSIYLHDTPSRQLFTATRRTFSHGCVRLEHPLELAEILLRGQDGWTSEKIGQVLATGETQNVELEHPLPTLIVYWTVSVGASGRIRHAEDIYNLDPPLLAALDAPPGSRHAAIARSATPSQPGP